MSKVSIMIPSRNETYEIKPGVTVLQRMIDDIYEKATGDFEVIVIFDGPPYQELPEHPNLNITYLTESIGMRPCINLAASIATGKYIYKSDSHCMFGEGFDEILQKDMQENWIVVPRFYVLDAENWKWQDERFYDYFYLPCPMTDKRYFRFQAGGHWIERTRERINGPSIDETMQFHGSGWFADKQFFLEKLGGVSSEGYDTFGMEPPELGLKMWLGPWDGKLMVNKNTWYAHMHKGGQRPRGYDLSQSRIRSSYNYGARYWMLNSWEERVRDIEWLVDRFYPIPTWPENWKELLNNWRQNETK